MTRPTYRKSKGPNGTRLAPKSPYPSDPGLVTTTIKPTGGLAFGLRDYTSKDFQNGWDIINAKVGRSGWGMVLMEPGGIRGYGSGQAYDPALDNVGGDRDNRILFWPRDGWGSVSFVGKGVKITSPRGWTLGGIRGGENHEIGLLVVGPNNFGVWRTTAQSWNAYGKNGQLSSGCDFVEMAMPNSWVFETDSTSLRSASIADRAVDKPGPIDDFNMDGIYIAPTWRPVGSTSHTDSLQWSGDSPYGGSTVKDAAIFSSTNHGVIIGGAATDTELRNVAVIGMPVGLARHPVTGTAPANSKFAGKGPGTVNNPIALNGTGAPGALRIYDSIFIGPMKNIENVSKGGVIQNVQVTSEDAEAGDARFTLDRSLLEWTQEDLDREVPFPSDAFLTRVWAVDGVFPEEPENPEGPGNPGPVVPGGILTQDKMPSFAQAWALATPPLLSYNAAATVSGVSVAPTDAKVVHTGAAAKAIVPAATPGYFRPNYLADSGAGTSTNPNFMPAYGSKVRTASQVVEVALQQRPDLTGGGITTRTPVRIIVDGQWTDVMPTFLGPGGNIGYAGITPSFISAGTKFWLRLEFESARDREIEIVSMLEYAGWSVPAGQTFLAPAPVQHTIVWDMDSLAGAEKHGTGNYSLSSPEGNLQHATYSHVSSMAWYASKSLGYDSVVNSSSGSSGYEVSGETVRFISDDRTQFDVIEHKPQVVVVGVGFNDVKAGRSAAQLQAAATATLAGIRAGLPDAILVVLAIPSVPGVSQIGGAPAVAPYNAALKAAAGAGGAWLIDPILGDLFNPAGVRVADKPNMVTGNEARISSDGVHPTQEGARFFGAGYVADMLRLVHPAVGSGGPVVPPTDLTDPELTWVTDPTTPLRGTAILTVDAYHSTGIESVEFRATFQGESILLPPASKGAGRNYVLPFDTTSVPDNNYVVTATAKAVNGRTATAPETFQVDNSSAPPVANVKPTVTFLEPLAGAVLPRGGQVVFKGRATDDKLIASAGFRFRSASGLGPVVKAAPAVVGNNVYELVVEGSALVAGGFSGAAFTATDTGSPALSSETSVVAFSIAPVIDETDPTDFVLTVTTDGPYRLRLDWTAARDPFDQPILYRVLLDSLLELTTSSLGLTLDGLPAGSTPSIRIVAFDPDLNETSSNEVDDVTVLGQPTTTVLGTPTLRAVDVKPTSAGLVGGAPADTTGVLGYELRRGDVVVRRAESIADFEYVPVELEPETDYRFTLASVGKDETRSALAVAAFRTGALPSAVTPGWFATGPAVVSGAAGPVNGRVLVRYSSDVRTRDGQERTVTQQVVDAIDGRFYNPGTADLWQGYRSEDPADYIDWIEQFYGPDEKIEERHRRFRFPANATGSQVAYLDRIWLDAAPAGSALPVWAQELVAAAARVDAAAESAEASAERAKLEADRAEAGGAGVTITEADGFWTITTTGA